MHRTTDVQVDASVHGFEHALQLILIGMREVDSDDLLVALGEPRDELARERAEGREISYPVYLKNWGQYIVHFYFGDDFEVISLRGPASSRDRAFALFERGNPGDR